MFIETVQFINDAQICGAFHIFFYKGKRNKSINNI